MKIEERATPADSVVESRVDRDDAAATIVVPTVTNRDRRESSSRSVHVQLEDDQEDTTTTLSTFDRSTLVRRSTIRSAEETESS